MHKDVLLQLTMNKLNIVNLARKIDQNCFIKKTSLQFELFFSLYHKYKGPFSHCCKFRKSYDCDTHFFYLILLIPPTVLIYYLQRNKGHFQEIDLSKEN